MNPTLFGSTDYRRGQMAERSKAPRFEASFARMNHYNWRALYFSLRIDYTPPLVDRWPSGRRRTPGTRVGGQPSRGFESLSVRHSTVHRISATAPCEMVNNVGWDENIVRTEGRTRLQVEKRSDTIPLCPPFAWHMYFLYPAPYDA